MGDAALAGSARPPGSQVGGACARQEPGPSRSRGETSSRAGTVTARTPPAIGNHPAARRTAGRPRSFLSAEPLIPGLPARRLRVGRHITCSVFVTTVHWRPWFRIARAECDSASLVSEWCSRLAAEWWPACEHSLPECTSPRDATSQQRDTGSERAKRYLLWVTAQVGETAPGRPGPPAAYAPAVGRLLSYYAAGTAAHATAPPGTYHCTFAAIAQLMTATSTDKCTPRAIGELRGRLTRRADVAGFANWRRLRP